jgi:hypothetical protein
MNNSGELNDSNSEDYKTELQKCHKLQMVMKILLEPESPLSINHKATLILAQMGQPDLLGKLI